MTDKERIAELEKCLHGFCGFVRGGYAVTLNNSYLETLIILTKQAEKILKAK